MVMRTSVLQIEHRYDSLTLRSSPGGGGGSTGRAKPRSTAKPIFIITAAAIVATMTAPTLAFVTTHAATANTASQNSAPRESFTPPAYGSVCDASAGLVRLRDPFDDGGVGHAAAFAHGLEAVAATGALELVEQGGEQLGARAAERVTEGDGAAVHVHALHVGLELLLPCEHDR